MPLNRLRQDLRGNMVVAWNHVEFEVRYESLAEEVKIGACPPLR